MINRELLRYKVIQILYAYYKGEDRDYGKAESELRESIQRTYDLYFYLLMLIPAITDLARERRSKYASHQIINHAVVASEKFINNLLSHQISINSTINQYAEEHELSWASKKYTTVKSLLEGILQFDLYQKYSETEGSNNYEEDKELWKKIFRQVVAASEILGQQLEEESIYWNADEEIAFSFVVKTLKAFKEENGENQPMQPMFSSQEHRDYAFALLKNTIYNGEEYNTMIDQHIDPKKWDVSRIAFMDRIIMQAAVTEMLCFPTIPVSVTLNEYIEMTKAFSSEKSAPFVNGVLNSIVTDLRAQGRMLKVAYYSKNFNQAENK